MTAGTGSRRARRAAAALAAALAALALSACGEEPVPAGDAATGKGLFTSGCGGCHVLEDAGTQGNTGPNLDDAFRQARQDGWPESQIRAVTREWIALAEQPMPRDIFTGQEAIDVATYVAEAAGTQPESAVRKPRPIQAPAGFSPDEEEGEPPGSQQTDPGAEPTEPRDPSEDKGQPGGQPGGQPEGEVEGGGG